MECFQFGKTSNDLPILGYRFGHFGPKALILGGVHGDEPEGVFASHGLLEQFLQSFTLKMQITLIPSFNLDGLIARQRGNARGVDLNRNLPTEDWSPEVATPRYHPGTSPCSEPENQALVSWIEQASPQIIISLHSWKPLLNINGDIRPEAEIIHQLTGYDIHEDIGYPTPGCLGTYTGLERAIPTLTYEIERGLNAKDVVKVHVPALLEALKITQRRFQ